LKAITGANLSLNGPHSVHYVEKMSLLAFFELQALVLGWYLCGDPQTSIIHQLGAMQGRQFE